MEKDRQHYQVYELGRGINPAKPDYEHLELRDDPVEPEPKKHHLFPHAFNAGELIRECSDTVVEGWEDFKRRRFEEGREHGTDSSK